MSIKSSVLILITCIYLNQLYATELALQHGVPLGNDYQIEHYWVSEKLDGIRGYWDGQQLYTRQGNLINTPKNFTQNWPTVPLDGELWSQRGAFERIMSCVKRQHVTPPCWQNINFMVFDLPKHRGTFSERVRAMSGLLNNTNAAHLKMIRQERVTSKTALYQKLDRLVSQGGEGLMLHHQDAYYQAGRNNALMKLKPYQDSEATVIAHIPGKGKYLHMLGAVLVETPSGIRFKIGSGFTDQQRQNPPAIGSIITYKYIGKTARGVPRFASFIRLRQ